MGETLIGYTADTYITVIFRPHRFVALHASGPVRMSIGIDRF